MSETTERVQAKPTQKLVFDQCAEFAAKFVERSDVILSLSDSIFRAVAVAMAREEYLKTNQIATGD